MIKSLQKYSRITRQSVFALLKNQAFVRSKICCSIGQKSTSKTLKNSSFSPLENCPKIDQKRSQKTRLRGLYLYIEPSRVQNWAKNDINFIKISYLSEKNCFQKFLKVEV
jgi:hypothetical protein